MDKFTTKTVEFALNKLFSNSNFCICDVTDLIKITGAQRLPSYDLLRAYHCVDYADMDQETKEFIFKETIANITNVDSFPKISFHNPQKPVTEVEEQGFGTRLRTKLLGS